MLLSVGVLGEYMGRVYDQVRDRPLSLISKVHRSSVEVAIQQGSISIQDGTMDLIRTAILREGKPPERLRTLTPAPANMRELWLGVRWSCGIVQAVRAQTLCLRRQRRKRGCPARSQFLLRNRSMSRSDERDRVAGRKLLAPEIESVAKRLAATSCHMAVEAPWRFAVVESSPRASDDDFVRIFVLHCLVVIAQVLVTPIAAIRRPTLRPGLTHA